MPEDVLTTGLRAVQLMLTKARELPGMAADKDSLRLTEQDQRILLGRINDVTGNKVVMRRLAELTIASYFGLLRTAVSGYSFVPSLRIREEFGNTLAANYPEANETFLKFANGYWTYKLLTQDVLERDPEIVLSGHLSQLEMDMASLFFPTPGPMKGPSPAEREATQRDALTTCAPELDLDKFMRGNVILIRDRKGSNWFSRLFG